MGWLPYCSNHLAISSCIFLASKSANQLAIRPSSPSHLTNWPSRHLTSKPLAIQQASNVSHLVLVFFFGIVENVPCIRTLLDLEHRRNVKHLIQWNSYECQLSQKLGFNGIHVNVNQSFEWQTKVIFHLSKGCNCKRKTR